MDSCDKLISSNHQNKEANMKYLDIINKMTLEDKAKLCVGRDY